ncbi:MAG: dihydrofolate reductase family protein [Patescibacteria group bacterium]
MKVVMVAVSSVNGKLTKGDNPDIYSWTSKEDSKIFFSLIEKHNLIVMGSKTYEAARTIIKLRPNKLRMVLTRNRRKYKSDMVKGSLEFTSESPKDLIKRLEKQGYKEMLLVGGTEINSAFLKNSLVDELHLTIEPILFGRGKDLLLEEELEVSLKLLSIKKLNANGTLHLRYRVNK